MNTSDGTLHDVKEVPAGELVPDTWVRVGDIFVMKGGRFRVRKVLSRGRIMLKWIGEAK